MVVCDDEMPTHQKFFWSVFTSKRSSEIYNEAEVVEIS